MSMQNPSVLGPRVQQHKPVTSGLQVSTSSATEHRSPTSWVCFVDAGGEGTMLLHPRHRSAATQCRIHHRLMVSLRHGRQTSARPPCLPEHL